MTRKHYTDMANRFGELIAEVDNSEPTAGRNARLAIKKGIAMSIDAYCKHAKIDNPAFDKDRFLTAVNTAAASN